MFFLFAHLSKTRNCIELLIELPIELLLPIGLPIELSIGYGASIVQVQVFVFSPAIASMPK